MRHSNLTTNIADGRVEDGRGSEKKALARPPSSPGLTGSTGRPSSAGRQWIDGEAAAYWVGFGTVSNSPSPLDTAITGGACH